MEELAVCRRSAVLETCSNLQVHANWASEAYYTAPPLSTATTDQFNRNPVKVTRLVFCYHNVTISNSDEN